MFRAIRKQTCLVPRTVVVVFHVDDIPFTRSTVAEYAMFLGEWRSRSIFSRVEGNLEGDKLIVRGRLREDGIVGLDDLLTGLLPLVLEGGELSELALFLRRDARGQVVLFEQTEKHVELNRAIVQNLEPLLFQTEG